MSCHDITMTLSVWSPHDDLPDPVVEHLEGCEACMARFDARFPPARVHETPVAPGLRARLWGRSVPLPALALAAVAVLALAPLWAAHAPPAPAELALLELPLECPLDEVDPAPVCPV